MNAKLEKISKTTTKDKDEQSEAWTYKLALTIGAHNVSMTIKSADDLDWSVGDEFSLLEDKTQTKLG